MVRGQMGGRLAHVRIVGLKGTSIRHNFESVSHGFEDTCSTQRSRPIQKCPVFPSKTVRLEFSEFFSFFPLGFSRLQPETTATKRLCGVCRLYGLHWETCNSFCFIWFFAVFHRALKWVAST